MTDAPAAYRRTAGSERGEARKAALLEATVDDLATHGLVDFSLRRSAAAAGTTHKVLLYHFGSADELLRLAVARLRARRVENALATRSSGTLAQRVRAFWPVIRDDATGLRVIDQAIGLAMYDPDRYAHLAQDANVAYLSALYAICPEGWTSARRRDVSMLILCAMRGFLVEWRVTRDEKAVRAGLRALVRALEREESA